MNDKTSKSPRAASLPTDEPDDPGPSRAGAQPVHWARDTPEPVLRILGEAAGEVDTAWLREHLCRAASILPVPVRSVNVEVVFDDRMTSLHQQHLGIAETTDVLTFASSANDEPIEAEIAVCLDEARWRADQFEHAVERELLLYALHGLLHCAGFDDHDEVSFAAMHAEEDRILEAIGVGRTFWTEIVASGNADELNSGSEQDRALPRHRAGRDRGFEV